MNIDAWLNRARRERIGSRGIVANLSGVIISPAFHNIVGLGGAHMPTAYGERDDISEAFSFLRKRNST